MQEDMRMSLPAREPERRKALVEEATVKVLRTRGTVEERYRDAIQYEVKPGDTLVIDAVAQVDAARPEAERVEVRLMLSDDGAGERAYITFHPEPGRPLEIDPRDYAPTSAPTDAHMVRAVLVESVDINAMGRAVWTIDLLRTGHGDRPFHPGDLVIRTPGFQGFHEVVDIDLDHRSPNHIGLVVKPAPDLAFDLTPDPVVAGDDEPDEF